MPSETLSRITAPKLLPISDVRPSAYNPRQADAYRLGLLELSLKKLGFLLPLYADKDGELLSGHQRHYLAERLGVSHVPVAFTRRSMKLSERKAVNIAFNRGTNDMTGTDTPTGLTRTIDAAQIHTLAERLPDISLDSEDFYPCLRVMDMPIKALLSVNAGRWSQYATAVSRSLYSKGVQMPIVIRPGGYVLNGLGRLQMLAEAGESFVPTVLVPDDRAEFAEAMLNLLTMDFNIEEKYADTLRHNSFRRARNVRQSLGRGFIFALRKSPSKFSLENSYDWAHWKQRYGVLGVVDFGAGHLTETNMLRAAGIHVAAFEPYRITGGDEIDKVESIKLTREFLADIATGREYSSIFISSVLNSVPFIGDRRCIVVICAALCDRNTRLYACASSTKQTSWQHASGREYANRNDRNNLTFKLDYEPGIKIGELSDKPKVQKFHTAQEFRELFAGEFRHVQISEAEKNVQAECWGAYPVGTNALRLALRFEFDLPYPDGSRMGLVQEAFEAFSQRLGVQL
jgi:hypothetical protein